MAGGGAQGRQGARWGCQCSIYVKIGSTPETDPAAGGLNLSIRKLGTPELTLPPAEQQHDNMFVFGSAADANADANADGGRGKSPSTTDDASSFTFDTSFLPTVKNATPTTNGGDTPTAGGFKFNVPPTQDPTAAAEGGDETPLFGSTFRSRHEVGAGAAMKVCGACERTLPDGSYSQEQWRALFAGLIVFHRGTRRQGIMRCEECVASGNQLMIMKKGRKRSEEDDCPICQLPQPIERMRSTFRFCCMKRVCDGCILAADKRGMTDCPFCRAPAPEGDSQALAMIQKRVDAGDPVAIWHLGYQYAVGGYGLQKDVTRATELYERAAELGEQKAHFSLGYLYGLGEGVAKDTAKAIRHFEAAAVKGDAYARNSLGVLEYNAGNYDLALQHYMIAAKLGYQLSLDNIKTLFMKGLATKADYAEALRGHQSAAEEMRSPDREEALALGKK